MFKKINIQLPDEFSEPIMKGYLCTNDLVLFLVEFWGFKTNKTCYKTALIDLIYDNDWIIDWAHIVMNEGVGKWELKVRLYKKG